MRSGRAQAQDARDVLLRDPRSHPHQHPPLRPGRRFHLNNSDTTAEFCVHHEDQGDAGSVFHKTTVDDPADLKHHKVLRLDWKTRVAVMDYEKIAQGKHVNKVAGRSEGWRLI